MKIKLKIEKHNHCSKSEVKDIKESGPFVMNPRGRLIHRVRAAYWYLRDGIRHHMIAQYHCGNRAHGDESILIENPPEERLLCFRCEAIAVAAGEKPASELAGRHVHIGRMVPQRICCKQNKN